MGILLLARGGLELDRSNTAFRGLVHATVRAFAAPGELPLLDGHPLFFVETAVWAMPWAVHGFHVWPSALGLLLSCSL